MRHGAWLERCVLSYDTCILSLMPQPSTHMRLSITDMASCPCSSSILLSCRGAHARALSMRDAMRRIEREARHALCGATSYKGAASRVCSRWCVGMRHRGPAALIAVAGSSPHDSSSQSLRQTQDVRHTRRGHESATRPRPPHNHAIKIAAADQLGRVAP